MEKTKSRSMNWWPKTKVVVVSNVTTHKAYQPLLTHLYLSFSECHGMSLRSCWCLSLLRIYMYISLACPYLLVIFLFLSQNPPFSPPNIWISNAVWIYMPPQVDKTNLQC
jgi:hypothetical protein